VVDFDPTAGMDLVLPDAHDQIFVTGLSTDGAYLGKWIMPGVGPLESGAKGIAIDTEGGILVTGEFAGDTDFDPGAALDVRSSNNDGLDFFLTRLGPGGSHHWTRTFGSDHAESGRGIAPLPDGIVVIGTVRTRPTDLDVGCAQMPFGENDGATDTFIMRMVCMEASADADDSGAVDLLDFAEFGQCFSGSAEPGLPVVCPSGCYNFDFDHDDDIDLPDHADFLTHFAGP